MPALFICGRRRLAIIILWLVLWLAVKVPFGAVHLLVVLGIVMLAVSFLKTTR